MEENLTLNYFLDHNGYCPICETEVRFSSKHEWLRDHYKCSKCTSIPRERALMDMINKNYPNWKSAVIHESSPGVTGVSPRLRNEAKNYISSQYLPKVPLGESKNGILCQNLEALTFEDNCIDLHIT